MVHITVMSCCSNADAARHLSSSWQLLPPAHHACRRALELLQHKTLDFTPDVVSQQTRPQFCRLQIIESNSGTYLPETVRDVKHRWWAVVMNRTFY